MTRNTCNREILPGQQCHITLNFAMSPIFQATDTVSEQLPIIFTGNRVLATGGTTTNQIDTGKVIVIFSQN